MSHLLNQARDLSLKYQEKNLAYLYYLLLKLYKKRLKNTKC